MLFKLQCLRENCNKNGKAQKLNFFIVTYKYNCNLLYFLKRSPPSPNLRNLVNGYYNKQTISLLLFLVSRNKHYYVKIIKQSNINVILIM